MAITPNDMAQILAAVSSQQGPPSMGEGFPNPVATLFQAGNTLVINGSGLFVYAGQPAAGNLIGYWTTQPGTDSNGNQYGAGLALGEDGSQQIQLIPAALSASGNTVLQMPQNLGDESSPSTIQVGVYNGGQSNQIPYLSLAGPVNSNDPALEGFEVQLAAASDDNTVPQQLIITDASGIPYITLYGTPGDIQGIIGGGVDSSGSPVTTSFLPLELNGALVSYGLSSGGQVIKTFNSSTTWTCPAGVTAITAQAIGGGAGGQWASGPGGGGGGYGGRTSVAVTPGNTYAVTVGSGGAGGTSSSGSGKAGGNSSFSGDSVTVTGFGAPINNTSPSVGGSGSGSFTFSGGGNTATGGVNTGGGGGGGGAGTGGNGSNGAHASGTAPGSGGNGGIAAGASAAGGHGGGGGWGASGNGSTTTGGGGSVPGGGGGSGGSNSTSGSSGGAGAHGQVILTYTLPGSTAIASSLASSSGTDSSGNAYPAGYQGPVVAVKPNSSPSLAEGWHSISLASGLTGTLRCKRLAESNFVLIDVDVTFSYTGSGQVFTCGSLPSSDYYPTLATRTYPMSVNGTPSGITAAFPRLFVGLSGGIQLLIPSGSGTGAVCSGSAMVALD